MQCALCGTPIEQNSAWKGAGAQFYCNEFCADSEEAQSSGLAAAPTGSPTTLIDLHRNRPYERLERLLPYMRRYSARTSAAPASA